MKRPSVAHFGRYIRAQRQGANLSLPDLAKMAGISKGNLSKIENGGDPQLSTVKMLCDSLNIRAQFISKIPTQLPL